MAFAAALPRVLLAAYVFDVVLDHVIVVVVSVVGGVSL